MSVVSKHPASCWYAVRSATRRETAAAEALEEQGFTVFLPMETRWRRTGIVKEIAYGPLLPGYLFVLCRERDLARVNACDGVHQIVSGYSEDGELVPMSIPTAAVIEIQANERAGVYDYTIGKKARYHPRKGEKVQVTAGPWLGFLAKVLNTPRSNRVHLMTEGPFGRGITIDVAHVRAA